METHILFFVAAVAAGAINTLAGGGGLLTFPLLTLVLSPVAADATSSAALLPAYPTAVWSTRRELAGAYRRWLGFLLATSAVGGLAGTLMLVRTDDRNFVFLVPWVVLGARRCSYWSRSKCRRIGVNDVPYVKTPALEHLLAPRIPYPPTRTRSSRCPLRGTALLRL